MSAARRRAESGSTRGTGKHATFWAASLAVLAADVATKYPAHTRITEHSLLPVVGEWVRVTRLYNPGAAFGFYLGPYSRWIFTGLALVAVAVMGAMYRDTRSHDRRRGLALGLVVGGALGNLVNRLWSERGVVDWIDVGVGAHRWPAFNVADIGVSVGAVLLAFVLWREDASRAGTTHESEAG